MMLQFNSARSWAASTLLKMAESANSKTNLKHAQADLGPDALVDEVLIIAHHKRDAYRKARGGTIIEMGVWITTNRKLAEAAFKLMSYGLPFNEVPMMPEECA